MLISILHVFTYLSMKFVSAKNQQIILITFNSFAHGWLIIKYALTSNYDWEAFDF